jgi:hypothetical protein
MFPVGLVPLILVILVAVMALIILTIPLDLQLSGSRKEGAASLHLYACWSIFGLGYEFRQQGGRINLLMSGQTVYSREIVPSPGRAGIPLRPRADFRKLSSQICIIQVLLPGILRILGALKRYGRFRGLSCDLVIGTGRAADTGLVFGIFSAVRPLLMVSPKVSLSLRPVFDREVLEGDCRIDFRLERPLVIIALFLRLALSPRTWKLLKKCRNGGIRS